MSDDAAPAAPPRPTSLRVYVNERGVDVPAGGSALDAVQAFDAVAETAHAAGLTSRALTLVDSRGLIVDPASPAHGGAIYRVLPARSAGAAGGRPA